MNYYSLAILYSDSYKQCHPRMYPKGTTKLVSYWVPRRSMFGENDTMIFFGLQPFIKEYLIELFNNSFFNISKDYVRRSYSEIIERHLGLENVEIDRVMALHELGYLPLKMRALPEGTIVPMGVPCIELTNTHPDFAWVVQWVECILQAELWKPCCHATMAKKFRNLADTWYSANSDGNPAMAMADFGMRGMSGIDEAVKASAAWLTSFNKTSTIPAIDYIDFNYENCPYGIGLGAVSTEHSVMSANFAVDGDEISFVKRALTELYPNTSFSMVSDTYDYWNMIDNILPACKKEIMEHNGKLLVRPDSGDIVEISINTVLKLWNTFGGTVNSKGYKVLNSHIGIIYGDGCTLEKIEQIWSELDKAGFAADNIVFGVGAFSFAAMPVDDKMIIYTRDTYGIAMKATYAIINGESVFLYKDPKTDTSHLKKSQKGLIDVWRDPAAEGKIRATDGLKSFSSNNRPNSLWQTVFEDGKIVKETTFEEIRERIARGN